MDFILTPMIIASWPAITAALSGAAVTLGLSAHDELRQNAQAAVRVDQVTTVELTLEDAEVVLERLEAGQEIVLHKEEISVRIGVVEGRVQAVVCGVNRSPRELEAFGRQVFDRLTQIYVYNKLVTGLREHSLQVVEQGVGPDHTVRVKVQPAPGQTLEVAIALDGKVLGRLNGAGAAQGRDVVELLGRLVGKVQAVRLSPGELAQAEVTEQSQVQHLHIQNLDL